MCCLAMLEVWRTISYVLSDGKEQTYSNVIDPDIVCSIQGDGISAPNIFRVDIGDLNVLENDVLSSIHDPQALAFDDTLGTIANDCLV